VLEELKSLVRRSKNLFVPKRSTRLRGRRRASSFGKFVVTKSRRIGEVDEG